MSVFQSEQRKKLSEHQACENNIYISKFEGMELSDYIKVASVVCEKMHQLTDACCSCQGLLKVARHIVREGWMNLKEAFHLSSPGKSYTPKHARQKLLQMPLAAIAIGTREKGNLRLILVQKQQFVNYTILQSLLSKSLESKKEEYFSKEEMKKLFTLAESEAERERLRFAIVKGSGMSDMKARSIYGFHNMSFRSQKVIDAAEEAQAITECVLKVAQLKDKALLRSFGINDSEDEESESESESDSDCDDTLPAPQKSFSADKDHSNKMGSEVDDTQESGDGFPVEENSTLPHQFQLADGLISSDETYKHVTETEGVYMNSHQLLEILRKCELNWFQFVMVLRHMSNPITKEALEQLLLDFAGQLPFLGLSTEDERITEQSRQAYMLSQRMQASRSQNSDEVVSESDSSENEMLQDVDLIGERAKAFLHKKRAALKRKGIREAKRRIAERRFQKRHRSKRVSKLLRDCPDVGQEIENYVKSCGAGADAWRRTGVLTFDGNRTLKQKATFKKIKEHLEQKYNRSIAYGTVVQLCVARNRRRRSAARYKGIANVTQRRARKGFNQKYNPDQHWSSALYASLDKLQYNDGQNIVNLGRDDQAGFRLDTMTTHKLHSTLSVRGNEPLTTYTDYVNKYPSTLQTTSYNFPSTETTGEICCGVVKATPLHNKNAAQHFADLEMIENEDTIRPAFVNPGTQERKKVECIRVDGGYDEGPSHKEVQYWWTRRHIEAGTVVTLVTSRNSGASFRNRVELQNGCLALGHANLFIPSTLNGSCVNQSGGVNQQILHQNLDSAIDVYISRVDGAPCAATEIRLFKGAESSKYQEENEVLKVFLKGSKDAKSKLATENPVLYSKVKDTMDLRERHLRKNVPSKYVFMLECCFEEGCVHPVCKEGRLENETWYPGGPCIAFFPLPVADPDRPFNCISCEECGNNCSGHYMGYDKLLERFSKQEKLEFAQPPSVVLLQTYNQLKRIPPYSVLLETAQRTLLPVEEVKMWFEHLHQIAENRKAGAKKAAIKRREMKRAGKTRSSKGSTVAKEANSGNVDKDSTSDLCQECGMADPPDCEGDTISWLSCDGCLLWWHITCLGFEEDKSSDQLHWLCLKCSEVW